MKQFQMIRSWLSWATRDFSRAWAENLWRTFPTLDPNEVFLRYVVSQSAKQFCRKNVE